MSIVQGRGDSPAYVPSNYSDKFARIDKNANIRNAQYITPMVPAHHGHLNPQFSKSPLTSIEMYRKNRSRSSVINQGPGIAPQQSIPYQQPGTEIDWKQIIFWALIALALIGLGFALYFLIRSMGKENKDTRQNLRAYPPEVPSTPTYTGINPIYVSPIPYSNMQQSSYAYTTYPDSNYGYDYTTTPATITAKTSTISQSTSNQNQPTVSPQTQPTVHYNPDPSNSYVNPVDVYNWNHQ